MTAAEEFIRNAFVAAGMNDADAFAWARAERPLSPPREPLLMIRPKDRLSCEEANKIREEFARFKSRGGVLIIDRDLSVYQLVDGKWIPVDQTPPDEAL